MNTRIFALLFASMALMSTVVSAQKLSQKVIYQFPYEPYTNCSPIYGVHELADGSFLGQSKLAPNNSRAFTLAGPAFNYFPSAPTAQIPLTAGYTVDANGVVWGVAAANGPDPGYIFKLQPDGSETKVYQFGSTPNDGRKPNTRLVLGGDKKLYGTTATGGGYGDGGTVFQIDPNTGTYIVLHRFNTSQSSGIYPDGAYPAGELLWGLDGAIYGVTSISGAFATDSREGSGTLFKVDRRGAFTKLYTFGPSNNLPGSREGYPSGTLAQTADGTLYGTTSGGSRYGLGAIWSYNVKKRKYRTIPIPESLSYTNGLVLGPYGRIWGNSVFYLYSVDAKGRIAIESSYNSPYAYGGQFPLAATSRGTLVATVPDGGAGYPEAGAGCGYVIEFSPP